MLLGIWAITQLYVLCTMVYPAHLQPVMSQLGGDLSAVDVPCRSQSFNDTAIDECCHF